MPNHRITISVGPVVAAYLASARERLGLTTSGVIHYIILKEIERSSAAQKAAAPPSPDGPELAQALNSLMDTPDNIE